jgi:hypothetical protein
MVCHNMSWPWLHKTFLILIGQSWSACSGHQHQAGPFQVSALWKSKMHTVCKLLWFKNCTVVQIVRQCKQSTMSLHVLEQKKRTCININDWKLTALMHLELSIRRHHNIAVTCIFGTLTLTASSSFLSAWFWFMYNFEKLPCFFSSVLNCSL